MLNIAFTKRTLKFLSDLPAKHHKQVTTRIFELCSNPFDNSDVKALAGYKDFYRATSGEYRIVFSVTDTVLSIETIGPRNDDAVYKELSRLH